MPIVRFDPSPKAIAEGLSSMNELVQVLQSPTTLAMVDALRHAGSSLLDPTTILENIGNGIEAKVGSGLAGAFMERIVRFGKAQLASESVETIEMSLKRIGKLCDALADRISELEANGVKIDAAHFRATFNEPNAAASLKVAMIAATETDAPQTVDTLALLLVQRLQASPGSRMALRVRQASDAVRDLQLRELYALGVQALIVSQRGVLNLGGRTAGTEDDRLTISAWYDKNVPRATVVKPSIDDMWQLQAHGLVIQSSTAAEYEARLPPHGSIVASVWEQAGGSAYDRSSPAMALIEQLELGVDAHGDRAFERPSLAAYRLTEAGFLLGVMFLRQLAVDVPTNFSGWV